MSNRRFIVIFMAVISLCAAVLWGLSLRARVEASETTRHVLCPVAMEKVTALEIDAGERTICLSRAEQDAWRITVPYRSEADGASVACLLDALTSVPLTDMRTARELAALEASWADFQLDPPVARVRLAAGGETNVVRFGARVPSCSEVYAAVEGLRNVFTVPASVLACVPSDADALRPRALFACSRDEMAGLEFRSPDQPFVKLVREGAVWRMSAPAAALADSGIVTALTDSLLAARVEEFVLPSTRHPGTSGIVAADGLLSSAVLAPYGLSADAALSVCVRKVDGRAETVSFGGPSGTNRVWALVRNGTAVVTVPAELVERCRAREASLRDTRVFALAPDERLTSVSLTVGGAVYVLRADDKAGWRLEAPVVAPTDPVTAASFVENVLKLKQSDLMNEGQGPTVQVAVGTTASSRPSVAVPAACFQMLSSWADLRSKTLMTLDPAAVFRLSVTKADGSSVTVTRDPDQAFWRLETPLAGRRVKADAVKALLSALARVEASGVETVAATPEDFRRCGLAAPAFVVSADLETERAVRRNVLIGGAASGGGRYATVGGADAVFVISRQTAAALTADVTE